MEALAVNIARVEAEIEEQKGKRRGLDVAHPLCLALTEEITETKRTLTLLLQQQGKFTYITLHNIILHYVFHYTPCPAAVPPCTRVPVHPCTRTPVHPCIFRHSAVPPRHYAAVPRPPCSSAAVSQCTAPLH